MDTCDSKPLHDDHTNRLKRIHSAPRIRHNQTTRREDDPPHLHGSYSARCANREEKRGRKMGDTIFNTAELQTPFKDRNPPPRYNASGFLLVLTARLQQRPRGREALRSWCCLSRSANSYALPPCRIPLRNFKMER